MTVPGTKLFALSFKSNVLALTVWGDTGSLNEAVSCGISMGTQFCPFAGDVELTVGGVVSGVGPVVKLHEYAAARALPAISVTPVVTVTVYVANPCRAEEGANVATLLEYVTTPPTGLLALSLSSTVEFEIVAGSIASLKVTVTTL